MKQKQSNLSNYMNFSKKTKSTKKGKHKSMIPNFIDSTINKYSNYLQSSLKEEDIFLLKRKLKGYSKIHSHSSSNAKKNNEKNKTSKKNNKMPTSSYISYMSPGNNYLTKKKKDNIFINKALKNHLMLTSMNNSSIIHSSKDKGLSYSINNISNYQSNQNNINNILYNNKKRTSFKNNSIPKKGTNESEIFNQKNNNNNMEINIIKKTSKDKKYSLTSMNSRKNSIDKEEGDIMKKLHKLNFDGLFKNNNFSNKKIISSSKNSAKNINNNLNKSKKLYLGDFFNLKKKGKYSNNFLEIYFKAPQSSNNRKIKKYANNNSNNHHKSMSNYNNPITNNTISPNNNFSSTNYSPINDNRFFKTAKVSPRTSFPKKKQELQSHRVTAKNKISGNILAFYNNYKKSNVNNYFLYGHSFNLDNNSHYVNNKNNSQKSKKIKKTSMNTNMNITSNNNNFNINKNINNNKVISNINFPKCSSLNKIKNNNYINAYNSNNNAYINKKVINPIMNNKKYSNENPINNSNNIINNCQININNINYNNYNQNISHKNNQLMNDKIMNLFKKKNLVDISNSKIKKIFSQSQQEIILTKKQENKNFTTNNSPINKNSNCIKIKNNVNINKDNTPSNIKNTKNSSNNNSNRDKPKIKNKDKDKESKDNNNLRENLLNKKSNKYEENKNDNLEKIKEKKTNNKNEILELKQNLQKNKNSSNNIINSKNKTADENIENKIINTLSCSSSITKDSNYYLEKCNSLSKYIKEYHNKYKEYPPTDLNFYLYGRLIGQGAFGKVNIGLNILSGRVVAIKSFNKIDLNKNGENMRKILYETNLMKKLNHPNITKILEMFEDDNYILIAMEYINGGNLFSFVKKRRKLSEKTAKFLFKQIILGIKHIHSHKIIHRDIKLENILIDLNNNVKICDFGIGRILTSNKQLLHDKCGTPMYMAPEILLSSKNQGYEGYPVDVWSSGISLYIMLSGTLPFNLKNNENSSIEEESYNNLELQYSIINKEPKHIEKISDEARDLLKGLLNKNPNERLTIDQILNHPWLKMDENYKQNNKKYHLFTKAEMIMLSKTYIDYRNGALEDLKENFTFSNLKAKETNKNGKENKMKNISTKSSLLAPYNTLIQEDDSLSEYDVKDLFEDISNPNINLENDIIIINNKVKEYNLNYELNNNGECDNGMLINSKTGTISSSAIITLNNKNDSQLTSRGRNEDENNNILDELNENDNDEQEEEQEKKINKILDEIENLGYDREYVLNCVNKNILCHASTLFYLMLNYKNI